MSSPSQNARSVSTSCRSSSTFIESAVLNDTCEQKAIPRYVPIPHALLEVSLSSAQRSVMAALLARLPYCWNRLLDGRRLVVECRHADLARSCGVSVRTLGGVADSLEELALIRCTRRGRLATSWEVMPRAFGLPDDDIARRKLALSARRVYVAVPVHLLEVLSPASLSVTLELLRACGVNLFTRIAAGEEPWVAVTQIEIARTTGLSPKTVRRVLCDLLQAQLISGVSERGGEWSIRLRPLLLGVPEPNGTPLPNMPPEPDKLAEQDLSLPYHVHEENLRRGALSRAVEIYAILIAIACHGAVRFTSPSLRARVRRSALILALSGANADVCRSQGWGLACQRGGSASPEAVTDAVLERRASRSAECAREQQFVSRAPGNSMSGRQSPPAVLSARLNEAELAAWKWRREIEDGDPGGESFRELLGGTLPWEDGYVLVCDRPGVSSFGQGGLWLG